MNRLGLYPKSLMLSLQFPLQYPSYFSIQPIVEEKQQEQVGWPWWTFPANLLPKATISANLIHGLTIATNSLTFEYSQKGVKIGEKISFEVRHAHCILQSTSLKLTEVFFLVSNFELFRLKTVAVEDSHLKNRPIFDPGFYSNAQICSAMAILLFSFYRRAGQIAEVIL